MPTEPRDWSPFHFLFSAAGIRGVREAARFPWQSDPVCAQLPVTCHLPASRALRSFMCGDCGRGEREGNLAAISDGHRALAKQLV